MRRTTKQRFSKREQYKFILESLRYALWTKTPLFRAVVVQPEPIAPPDYPPIEVVIQMYGLPMTQGRRVKRPISAHRVAEFFKDWQIQEDFLKWYAKRIAANIPADSSLAGLKRSFTKLTAGRTGKLPPRIVLYTDYKTLVGEIRRLQEHFSGTRRSPIVHRKEDILRFGADTNANWAESVEKCRIYLDELFNSAPEDVAKLILSRQYGCKDGAVHDRLFRDS